MSASDVLREQDDYRLTRSTYTGTDRPCWQVERAGEILSVWPSRKLAVGEWERVIGQSDETIVRELVAGADELVATREATDRAGEALRQVVKRAHAQGLTLYRIEQVTGLARMTVRRWALDDD